MEVNYNRPGNYKVRPYTRDEVETIYKLFMDKRINNEPGQDPVQILADAIFTVHFNKVDQAPPNTPVRAGHPRYYQILEEMATLHDIKAHDYSGSETPLANFYHSRDFGIDPIWGVLTRMSDKWQRICNLAKLGFTNNRVKGETIRDSFRDLAAYCIIAEIIYTEEELDKIPSDYDPIVGSNQF